MENNTFKGTLFGGFDRDDVISYITKTSAESTARIDALSADIDKLSTQERELRAQLDRLRMEKDALSADLLATSNERDELRTALDRANTDLDALRTERSTLNDDNAALRAENTALRAETEELRPLAEQYAAVKAHIAGIELEARQRAEEYERGVRERLSAMVAECRAHCSGVLSVLGDTCTRVTEELRRTEESVSTLPSAFSTLRDGLEQLDESK